MNRILLVIALVAGLFAPALAQPVRSEVKLPRLVQLVQSKEVAISPAEAADIAASALPGFKPIKVKLLPSGVYAVTLKADGEVQRVMVDAETGAVQ